MNHAANGTIYPCRYVKNDPTAPGCIIQSGAGDPCMGISQKSTDSPALNDGVFPVNLDLGYAAVQGEQLFVYTYDDPGPKEVLLELGASVTNLQTPLKSDANGKGTPVTTAGDKYGAYPLTLGSVGQLIPVRLVAPAESYAGGTI